jgi:drug/metabolite transporter (DMT)-like permease
MTLPILYRWMKRLEQHPRRAAILYMLISTAGFSLMNIFVRMASESLSPTALVTLRNALTLTLIIPFVVPGRFAVIRTARLKGHIGRSIVGAVGMLAWTYSLTLMPLTHATALSFTTPLLVTLLAMLFLGEKADARHILALAVGFLGTLIILRPTAEGFDLNSLWVLLATASWATTSMFIKSLTSTEPPIRMVFYMNLFMFLIALPFATSGWHWPDAATWLALLGVSLCSILMHVTLVKAYILAPVVTLMPIDFMRLVFTSLLAYFFFGETSDLATWLGSAVIIASAVFASARKSKQALTD